MNEEELFLHQHVQTTGDPKKIRRKKIRRRILTILFVLLNVGIIIVTAYIDFSKEGRPSAPLGVNLRYLFAAAGCFLVALAAESSKFYIMIRDLNGSVSFRTAFEVAALGKYYDNITPTGAGGQPFQVYYLKKKKISTGVSAAIPLTGFFTLHMSFVILAIIVFLFGTPYLNNVADYTLAIKISGYIGILVYASIPLLIILFAVFPKAAGGIVRFAVFLLSKLKIVKNSEDTLAKALGTFTEYRDSVVAIYRKRKIFVLVVGFGLAYQILMCSLPYFVLRAFGSPLSYFSVFSMMVLIYCAITYIPTPGNSGVAEASFYALLATLNQGYLFWAMMIWRFFSYYAFLGIGGGIFLYSAIEKRRPAKQ
ncbi:MAG: flippase-like domain-containing protein [Oscillospiraceae bacterium]|nr:flippase-like domain-containing protein [Oscillospiraceae bacterium]